MFKRSYTILILPGGGRRFRKLQVSAGFLVCLALIATVGAVGALWAPHLLLQVQSQSVQVQRLMVEKQGLLAARDGIESELTQLSSDLDTLRAETERLSTALGVDDLPTSAPAAGGGGSSQTVGSAMARELDALRSRARNVDQSLAQLDRAFHQRISMLASTPNTMPVEGWFSHGFGWRKDPWSGNRQFHRGIDIVADAGTPVVASADGVISLAQRNGDYGKTIDISHGYGYVTRYAHLGELLMRTGQRVKRGDLIGRVGSTGRSTGAHLHYEVVRDARRVNPWKYLGQKGR